MPWLFSYGTLQLKEVQRRTFGRAPSSEADRLAGYRIVLARVANPDFVAETGKALHNTLVPCADSGCGVDGVSGRHAWVYVVENDHE